MPATAAATTRAALHRHLGETTDDRSRMSVKVANSTNIRSGTGFLAGFNTPSA